MNSEGNNEQLELTLKSTFVSPEYLHFSVNKFRLPNIIKKYSENMQFK